MEELEERLFAKIASLLFLSLLVPLLSISGKEEGKGGGGDFFAKLGGGDEVEGRRIRDGKGKKWDLFRLVTKLHTRLPRYIQEGRS